VIVKWPSALTSLRERSRIIFEIAAGAAIFLILLAAVIPTRPVNFASQPAPARTYAEALGRVAERQQADDRVAAPGGRSVFMTHGAPTSRVVVLFHGFTNSPRQYEHLAARLYEHGDNVYVPRLPHHAERNGNARTLAGLTATELRASADSAVDVAQGLGDSVIVAGVSAGGTLAAWVAQYRADVRRAVIVAPVFAIGRVPSLLDTPLMNLALRIPNLTRNTSPDSARPDRELGVSTRAIAQILRLGAAVLQMSKERRPLTPNIVFVVNANDHTVKTSAAIEVARNWSARGASPVAYQFPKSLGLPHDIAEEAHPNADTAAVYPALEALIHGAAPPAVLASHRVWPR
jgi:esterase/lipase